MLTLLQPGSVSGHLLCRSDRIDTPEQVQRRLLLGHPSDHAGGLHPQVSHNFESRPERLTYTESSTGSEPTTTKLF